MGKQITWVTGENNMPKRKGIEYPVKSKGDVLTVDMIHRAMDKLTAGEANINECFMASYGPDLINAALLSVGRKGMETEAASADHVLIPLHTTEGRIAARRYAELTDDQQLMDRIDNLDKDESETAHRLRNEKHSRP